MILQSPEVLFERGRAYRQQESGRHARQIKARGLGNLPGSHAGCGVPLSHVTDLVAPDLAPAFGRRKVEPLWTLCRSGESAVWLGRLFGVCPESASCSVFGGFGRLGRRSGAVSGRGPGGTGSAGSAGGGEKGRQRRRRAAGPCGWRISPTSPRPRRAAIQTGGCMRLPRP